MTLLEAAPGTTDISTRAFVILLVLSGAVLYGYWKLYMYFNQLRERYIRTMEEQHRVQIVYSFRSMKVRGPADRHVKTMILLRIFLLSAAAIFIPLLLTAILVLALEYGLPDDLWTRH